MPIFWAPVRRLTVNVTCKPSTSSTKKLLQVRVIVKQQFLQQAGMEDQGPTSAPSTRPTKSGGPGSLASLRSSAALLSWVTSRSPGVGFTTWHRKPFMLTQLSSQRLAWPFSLFGRASGWLHRAPHFCSIYTLRKLFALEKQSPLGAYLSPAELGRRAHVYVCM